MESLEICHYNSLDQDIGTSKLARRTHDNLATDFRPLDTTPKHNKSKSGNQPMELLSTLETDAILHCISSGLTKGLVVR